ncbi:MAG: hypothetical protein U7126_06835 [Microcoleus sp.]
MIKVICVLGITKVNGLQITFSKFGKFDQDRDENAAKNIEQVGMGNRHDSKRTQRQSKTTPVASVGEASRITAPTGR